MNDKINDIIYTAQDIEHYHSGKLTPLQMHKMEKAALDDPFLAEAMEGYAGVKEKEWKHELAGLKSQFENNDQGAKVIPLSKRKNNWWKVAAAVLLIGSTSAIAYFTVNKKDSNEIATTKPIPKEQPHIDSNNSNNITTQPAATATTITAVTPEVKTITPVKNNTHFAAVENTADAKETKVSDSAFVYTANKLKSLPLAKQNTETGRADLDDVGIIAAKPATAVAPPVNYNYTNVERKAEEKILSNNAAKNGLYYQYDKSKSGADTDGYMSFKKEAQLNRNFIAQVVGPDNSPLPFANISIKSENFGTYADAKGNFRLVSSDSVLTVEVKAAGYQPKFYTLQSYVQQNKIVLSQEDEASRYKAISGNSTAKSRTSRRATLVKDSLVNVEPADGWDNYNTYVDNNIEIPDDILNKNIHGRVELSFDVKSNGTITNIKVDKSLCDNCDELAKRLIEQGPQWKVKKGKKGKGKVSVEF
jgi:hypothetical protein